jgi:hypothetical protein
MNFYCLFVLLLFNIYNCQSQDLLEQLKNSVERAEGGSGAIVVYNVYLTPTNIRTYHAEEFDKGVLVEKDGKALYFELTKKIGEEQTVIIIHLESLCAIELDVNLVKGKYKYNYKFYY